MTAEGPGAVLGGGRGAHTGTRGGEDEALLAVSLPLPENGRSGAADSQPGFVCPGLTVVG